MSAQELLLECPACEQPCSTLPPNEPNGDYPEPHWIDGDCGTCQCGAEVRVEADGYACLVLRFPGDDE